MRLSAVVFLVFSCVSWGLYSADVDGEQKEKAETVDMVAGIEQEKLGRRISWSDPEVQRLFDPEEIAMLEEQGLVNRVVINPEDGQEIGWELVQE